MDINYNWPEDWKNVVPENLLGAKHIFADGDSIEVVAVKLRDFDG